MLKRPRRHLMYQLMVSLVGTVLIGALALASLLVPGLVQGNLGLTALGFVLVAAAVFAFMRPVRITDVSVTTRRPHLLLPRRIDRSNIWYAELLVGEDRKPVRFHRRSTGEPAVFYAVFGVQLVTYDDTAIVVYETLSPRFDAAQAWLDYLVETLGLAPVDLRTFRSETQAMRWRENFPAMWAHASQLDPADELRTVRAAAAGPYLVVIRAQDPSGFLIQVRDSTPEPVSVSRRYESLDEATEAAIGEANRIIAEHSSQ